MKRGLHLFRLLYTIKCLHISIGTYSHCFVPKLAINGDVGWLSAEQRLWYNMLWYWNRLTDMDNWWLCKKVLLWDNSKCTNNWSAKVKDIMNKLGFTRNFEHLESCDINTGKTLLHDVYAILVSKTINSSKMKNICNFKTSYTVEKWAISWDYSTFHPP